MLSFCKERWRYRSSVGAIHDMVHDSPRPRQRELERALVVDAQSKPVACLPWQAGEVCAALGRLD